MHRVGGIEKQDGTGNVNYDPANHEFMTRLRAEKIAGIANDIPLVEVDDEDDDAELLVIGWGSTWGSVKAAVRRIRAADKKVASAQLIHLNPFPRNLGEVLAKYPKVLVPEMNLGQLVQAAARRVPRRRAEPHQGAGTPVPRRRDRDEDPGDDRWLTRSP